MFEESDTSGNSDESEEYTAHADACPNNQVVPPPLSHALETSGATSTSSFSVAASTSAWQGPIRHGQHQHQHYPPPSQDHAVRSRNLRSADPQTAADVHRRGSGRAPRSARVRREQNTATAAAPTLGPYSISQGSSATAYSSSPSPYTVTTRNRYNAAGSSQAPRVESHALGDASPKEQRHRHARPQLFAGQTGRAVVERALHSDAAPRAFLGAFAAAGGDQQRGRGARHEGHHDKKDNDDDDENEEEENGDGADADAAGDFGSHGSEGAGDNGSARFEQHRPTARGAQSVRDLPFPADAAVHSSADADMVSFRRILSPPFGHRTATRSGAHAPGAGSGDWTTPAAVSAVDSHDAHAWGSSAVSSVAPSPIHVSHRALPLQLESWATRYHARLRHSAATAAAAAATTTEGRGGRGGQGGRERENSLNSDKMGVDELLIREMPEEQQQHHTEHPTVPPSTQR